MADENKKASPEKIKDRATKPGPGSQGSEAKGGRVAGRGRAAAAEKGDQAKAPPEVLHRSSPPRLKQLYEAQVVTRLMSEFKFTNRMQVPRLVKITLNMGMGEAISNPKVMDSAVEELRSIAGQQPVVTKAKKSIATFKLREGQKIGCMVTLRREKMWEFFDRLVSFALPRVRDFKGISPRSFDGRGNFSLGIREQIIFPEINYDKIDKIKGLNVSIVTTARTDEEGRALLRYLGMPFRS